MAEPAFEERAKPLSNIPFKPTNEMILSWLSLALGGEQMLDADIQSDEGLYFQSFGLNAPVGMPVARVGTAPADADMAVEALQPAEWVGVTVEPPRDTKDWQVRSDRRSKWLRSLVAYWRKDHDILNELLWAELVQRRRYAFVGYDPLPPELEEPPTMMAGETIDSFQERMGMYEYAVAAHVPFTFEIKPRGACFGVENGGRLQYVYEHYVRTVADLLYWYPKERYPRIANIIRGMDMTDTITFTAFWSKHWRAAYVNEQWILPTAKGTKRGEEGIVANQYGCIPFVEFYFRKLPVEDLTHRYRSLYSPTREMYRAESQVASQYLAIINRSAWPTILAKFIDGRQFAQGPGQVFYLKPGETVEAFQGEGPLPQVGEAWDRIRFAIRQSSLGAGAGNMPPGIRSAMAFSMAQGVDKNKIMPALRNLARGLEQALTIAERILENLHRAPVSLPTMRRDMDPEPKARQKQVITLNWGDIMGYYEKRVDFGPRFGPEVLQRAMQLGNLVQSQFFSRRTAWSLVPEAVVDATDEEDTILQEQSDHHPLMILAHTMRRMSTYDPETFQWMMQMGAFDPSTAIGGGAAGGKPGGGGGTLPNTAKAGGSTDTVMTTPGAAGQSGAPSQTGIAIPGASPQAKPGGVSQSQTGGRRIV